LTNVTSAKMPPFPVIPNNPKQDLTICNRTQQMNQKQINEYFFPDSLTVQTAASITCILRAIPIFQYTSLTCLMVLPEL